MVITILGNGNVGSHLAARAAEMGHVVHVWSRSLGAQIPEAELYVICVKDEAIPEVAALLPEDAIVAHTSGSTNIEVLPQSHRGVLYPMQTFSKNKPLEWSNIPLFIEGDDIVYSFAESLGAKSVQLLCSADRMKLHMAAVFACNFANHCYALGAELMEQAGLDWQLLLPLIDETAAKVHKLHPRCAQTGPAVREDSRILALHEATLNPAMRQLYAALSESIISYKKND